MSNQQAVEKAILLGAGGWIPTAARETSCIAAVAPDAFFVFDLGSGVRRLLGGLARRLIEAKRPIFVLLSHYHLDHLVGLTYLPLVFRSQTVTIMGPGASIGGLSTREALSRLCSSPFFSAPLERFPMDLAVGDLVEGENVVGGHLVEALCQPHSDPSLRLRLDGDLCYVTDTACDDRVIDFARGSRLLFHECWLDREGYAEAVKDPGRSPLTSHCHVDAVARLAKEAGVGRLVLTHLNPAYPESRLRRMLAEAREGFPGSELGADRAAY